jgi:hypothetical protein
MRTGAYVTVTKRKKFLTDVLHKTGFNGYMVFSKGIGF